MINRRSPSAADRAATRRHRDRRRRSALRARGQHEARHMTSSQAPSTQSVERAFDSFGARCSPADRRNLAVAHDRIAAGGPCAGRRRRRWRCRRATRRRRRGRAGARPCTGARTRCPRASSATAIARPRKPDSRSAGFASTARSDGTTPQKRRPLPASVRKAAGDRGVPLNKPGGGGYRGSIVVVAVLPCRVGCAHPLVPVAGLAHGPAGMNRGTTPSGITTSPCRRAGRPGDSLVLAQHGFDFDADPSDPDGGALRDVALAGNYALPRPVRQAPGWAAVPVRSTTTANWSLRWRARRCAGRGDSVRWLAR